MQKLETRNTYTPTDTSLVRGNCDPVLNREETLSVQGNTKNKEYFKFSEVQSIFKFGGLAWAM